MSGDEGVHVVISDDPEKAPQPLPAGTAKALFETLVIKPCTHCEGVGCERCKGTGDGFPTAASWKNAVAVVDTHKHQAAAFIKRIEATRAILSHKDDFETAMTAAATLVGTNKKKLRLALLPENRRDGEEYLRQISIAVAKEQKNFEDTTDANFDERLLLMNASIAKVIEQTEIEIDQMQAWIDRANELYPMIRQHEHDEEAATKPEVVPIETPERRRRTKAAGKVCFKPGCDKDPKIWDEKGKGWCKRHAPRKLRGGT